MHVLQLPPAVFSLDSASIDGTEQDSMLVDEGLYSVVNHYLTKGERKKIVSYTTLYLIRIAICTYL